MIDWLYQSFTAHQHQKGHTVPKQVNPLDDDDDITESTRKTMSWLYSLRTALRTALCESIRYQAKSEQNARHDLIPGQGAPRGGCSLHPDVVLNVLFVKRYNIGV